MNVYLDYAATSPLRAEVLERMLPCLKENFGNPDSLHAYGRRAAFLVTEARDRIAEVLGVRPNEIYFTSGGTEADNWAVCGLSQDGGVLASPVEHAAVLTPLSRLPRCAVCRAGEDGVISPAALAEALSGREISLVAVMAVNNETGVIQPVSELAAAAHEQGALFFSDCVQARCCDLKALTAVCDAVSLSAHKLGGPKGVGLLWVRKGVRLSPLIAGGEQERALRGGTLNVAGIVGMAEALSLARSEREAFISHTRSLRDAFEVIRAWWRLGDVFDDADGRRLKANFKDCLVAYHRQTQGRELDEERLQRLLSSRIDRDRKFFYLDAIFVHGDGDEAFYFPGRGRRNGDALTPLFDGERQFEQKYFESSAFRKISERLKREIE